MKTVKVVVLALAALGALAALSGCTDTSSRAILQVVNVNDGQVYYSDLVSDSGTVVADEVKVTLTSTPNAGTPALAPGTPFSQIILTGYTVTFDNGIYPPVSGGLSGIVYSGEEATYSIALSDLGAKAAVSTSTAVSTTARITINGFNHINGGNNGDHVSATASLPVQVANFKDSDINQ
ncbi:MAG TPA: hypothetical protein VFS09_12190 [Candidatus Eisenbacteria bacterium]|nr:hypothetical protein [Candidatus Eisenbacteria bacterium]